LGFASWRLERNGFETGLKGTFGLQRRPYPLTWSAWANACMYTATGIVVRLGQPGNANRLSAGAAATAGELAMR
jgi:hypothetical protein